MTERRKIAIAFDLASFQRIEELADACGTSIAATIRQLTDAALEERGVKPEDWARLAEKCARHYEQQIGDVHQVRIVPEPQLSKIKATHWRILAGWIRNSPGQSTQEK